MRASSITAARHGGAQRRPGELGGVRASSRRARNVLIATLASGGLFPIAACDRDPVAVDVTDDPLPTGIVVASESALIDSLAVAYRSLNATTIDDVLADRDGAHFVFVGQWLFPVGDMHWGAERERQIHRRMFQPSNLPSSEPPVAAELRILGIDLSLNRAAAFVENPDWYRSATNPTGLDPDRWRATQARYNVWMAFATAGYVFDYTRGSVTFVVVEDLQRDAGTPGKYMLYRWEDETDDSGAQKLDATSSWTRIKHAYAASLSAEGPGAGLDRLARAYEQASLEIFESAIRPEAGYRFQFAGESAPVSGWDASMELLAHARWFDPQSADPQLIPARLWPVSTTLKLEPRTGFVESHQHAAILDPRRWRVFEATYVARLQVTLRQGEILAAAGRSRFTIVEDLQGEGHTRFSLYRWEEIPPTTGSAPEVSGFMSLRALKELFLPRHPADSEAALVRSLAFVYWARETSVFMSLLAMEPGVAYQFVRNAPDAQTGDAGWTLLQEYSIHDRLFSTDPLRVPYEQQLRASRCGFTPRGGFIEQPQLYRSAARPEGIDPARWRVTAAVCDVSATFGTHGYEAFWIDAPVRLVILQDLTKQAGDDRRFLLHRWEDLAGGYGDSWTSLRQRYAP